MSQQINLYNPAFRPKRHTAAVALLAVVAVAVVAASLTAVYERYRLREVRAEALAVSLRLKEVKAGYDQLAGERGAVKPDAAREAQLLDLGAQVKRRKDIIAALESGVLGTSAGFSEFMRAFARQGFTGVWLTSFDIDAGGRDLTLSGRALGADLVPRYLERLNHEPVFQGRQFSAVRVEQPPASPAPPPPPPAPDAKAKDAKGEKSEKPRPPLLRPVEFSMSTVGREEGADARSAAGADPGIADRIVSDNQGVRLKPPAAPPEAPK